MYWCQQAFRWGCRLSFRSVGALGGMNTRAKGLAVFGSFVDSLKQKSSLRIQSLKKAGQLSGYKGCRKAFSEAQGTYAGNVRSKIEEAASNKAVTSPMK